MTAAERFAALVDDFRGRPGVTPPTNRPQFGGSALKVDGSIFAMLHREQLVVKLPADRVAELITSGAGAAFDNGRGSSMRQWLVVADEPRWKALAEEALTAVGKRTTVDPP